MVPPYNVPTNTPGAKQNQTKNKTTKIRFCFRAHEFWDHGELRPREVITAHNAAATAHDGGSRLLQIGQSNNWRCRQIGDSACFYLLKRGHNATLLNNYF